MLSLIVKDTKYPYQSINLHTHTLQNVSFVTYKERKTLHKDYFQTFALQTYENITKKSLFT